MKHLDTGSSQDSPEPEGSNPAREAEEDKDEENTEAILIDLITRHFDAALSQEEFSRLESQLLESEQACALYNELALQSMSLADIQPEVDISETALSFRPAETGNTSVGPRTLIAMGVALAAAAVLAISLVVVNEEPSRVVLPQTQTQTVRLEKFHGNVAVYNPSDDADPANLRAGDRIEISDIHGSASVTYPDGTRLLLAGETTLVFYGMKQKRLELIKGQMTADVAPQPPGKPMLVRTPEAELTVVGTAFSLSALNQETELGVTEGSVRMSKSSSKDEVNVASNQIARTAKGDSLLSPEALPPLPDSYAENFEPTLPARWQRGKEVKLSSRTGELTTAVQAEKIDAKSPLDRHHQILSHNDWNRGIFAIHEDSVLKFRYRFETSARFFHVLLGTRSFSGESQQAAVLEAKDDSWKQQAVGEWHDAEVPLDSLVTLAGEPRPENAGVFFILFDSQIQDPGLTIDDIRVERGL